MSSSTKIDLITFDSKVGEFALYLVESGPWEINLLQQRAESLEKRVFNSLEVILLGLLAAKYPESVGKPVRVQVDLHDGAPDLLYGVVDKVRKKLMRTGGQARIQSSHFIKGFRLVTREQLGRS